MEFFEERQDSEPAPRAWAPAGDRPSHPCDSRRSRAGDPTPRTPETLQGPSQLLPPGQNALTESAHLAVGSWGLGTSTQGSSGPHRLQERRPGLEPGSLLSHPLLDGPSSPQFVNSHVGRATLPFPVVPDHCHCSDSVCLSGRPQTLPREPRLQGFPERQPSW